MQIKHSLTAITLVLMMSAGVQAQTRVYETTDADGNKVFSDMPSENSQSIDIPETNIANPPPAQLKSPATESASMPQEASTESDREQGGRIIVNRDTEEEGRMRRDGDGDGFVTEHTPDGDILVNERERERIQEQVQEQEQEYSTGEHGVRRAHPRPRAKAHRGGR
jgi:hypothetical protein